MTRIALLLVLLIACERASVDREGGDDKKLLRLAQTISTVDEWRFTKASEEKVTWLADNADWSIDGAVAMLDAARAIAADGDPPERIEALLTSGVTELENIKPPMIGSRLARLSKDLGHGDCQVSRAPADVAQLAKQRLTSARPPATLSSALAARVERFTTRAARVDNFYQVSCGGPSPLLFGFLDGKPVPLFELVQSEDDP